MKLTNRLACVASKVPCGTIVADIGTDHAYIPIFLVQNDIVQKAIACDINVGPVNIAKKNIIENKLESNIETRIGSGLQVIKNGEIETVIIAGMGGLLIQDILSQSKELLPSIKTFILQPMIAQDILRVWLNNNGFKIVDETLAREGNKIYTILVVNHGNEIIEDDIYFEIGKKLIENKDPLLELYIKNKIKKTTKILENLKSNDSENALERKKQYEYKFKKYNEILKILKG